MSYHKKSGGEKQLKGANGRSHLGQPLSEAIQNQTISVGWAEEAQEHWGQKQS